MEPSAKTVYGPVLKTPLDSLPIPKDWLHGPSPRPHLLSYIGSLRLVLFLTFSIFGSVR